MNIIESNYTSKNGKDYYYAIINKSRENIQIFKNFGCIASILSFLRGINSISNFQVSLMFKIEFLGDSIDLSKISKKYSKFEII